MVFEEKLYFVYLLTNTTNRVIYCGVTNDLERRIQEHREKVYPNSFSARYNLWKLVYFEKLYDPVSAIAREKEIKGGNRRRKEILINSVNPEWADLYPIVFGFD